MNQARLRPDEAPGDDHALVARIVGGDQRAFEQLMRRHNMALFRTARAILRDDADAEDALQEAYLAAYRHQGEFLAGYRVFDGALERRLHLHCLGGEVPGDLVGHEHRDLADKLPEVPRRRVDSPENGELVPDQRVIQDGEIRKLGVGHA